MFQVAVVVPDDWIQALVAYSSFNVRLKQNRFDFSLTTFQVLELKLQLAKKVIKHCVWNPLP